ncbi:hypothetical protein J6590_067763 [Homalodisca vitripennis]|nr:hypothetical protein J6590_067763 [Homalodisca vitripennis]
MSVVRSTCSWTLASLGPRPGELITHEPDVKITVPTSALDTPKYPSRILHSFYCPKRVWKHVPVYWRDKILFVPRSDRAAIRCWETSVVAFLVRVEQFREWPQLHSGMMLRVAPVTFWYDAESQTYIGTWEFWLEVSSEPNLTRKEQSTILTDSLQSNATSSSMETYDSFVPERMELKIMPRQGIPFHFMKSNIIIVRLDKEKPFSLNSTLVFRSLEEASLDNMMNKMLEGSGNWEALKEMARDILRRKKEEGRLELA